MTSNACIQTVRILLCSLTTCKCPSNAKSTPHKFTSILDSILLEI